MRVLVTGGAGRVGRPLCAALARCGHRVLSVDLTSVADAPAQVHQVLLDITDRPAMRQLLPKTDAVVHLAGAVDAEDWDSLERLNIRATRALFDDVAEAGVKTIIYASSIHAAGYAALSDRLDAATDAAPDSPYGASKACAEAILRFMAARYGLRAFALRIGTHRAEPLTLRERTTWLSPPDMARLVAACLGAETQGYQLIWAFSRNARADVDREAWQRIGYEPQDDVEQHVARLSAGAAVDGDGFGLIGGRFVRHRQGEAREGPRPSDHRP